MKFKQRMLAALFIMILVPMIMTPVYLAVSATLGGGYIQRKYRVNILQLNEFGRSLILYVLLVTLVILVITAGILGVLLYRSIVTPILYLTNATKAIRDGNMDFELTPEGNVEEIRDLFDNFEQMRVRLNEANEEKVEFDRQNRELISNISHDLRTPLTAVRGYCEGIMDGVADTPEKMDRYVRTIYNKTNEMDRLINELSFYSKITTNRIPYVFDKVSARDFFDDAAAEIGEDVRSKGVAFTYENDVPGDVTVIADVKQITRVLQNIVGNSLKYMDKPEKRILLRIDRLGDELQVSVADNGIGISAKDMPYIFDRFYRADSSRHSETGGSGIGLSIVKKIIEDHGGRVWVSSRLGEGTTIGFALREYDAAAVGQEL